MFVLFDLIQKYQLLNHLLIYIQILLYTVALDEYNLIYMRADADANAGAAGNVRKVQGLRVGAGRQKRNDVIRARLQAGYAVGGRSNDQYG